MKYMKKTWIVLFAALLSINVHAQYANDKIQVGQDAPELEFKNPEGNIIKLSEIYDGRYVLVDFWASWCGPCRRANPRLVKTYREYKDKRYEGAKNGFTVLSVSMDQNKDKWVAAIAKDSLEWEYHMSDLGAWNSEPAQIYGVSYIPQAFLVSPEGKVVGKYNNAEEAVEELNKHIKVRKKFLGIL